MGVDHATRANQEADLISAPAWLPIIYACDNNFEPAKVEAYYRGVLSVLGRPVGIYGGDRLVTWAYEQLGIFWSMQTSSWSSGRVSPYARFLQRDHDVIVPGGVVDVVVPLSPCPTWKRTPMDDLRYGPADNAPETIYDLPGPFEVLRLEQPGVMEAMSGSLVPPTPSQILLAAQRAAARVGVKVYEYPGWRDRCRCHDGSHERGEQPNGRIWGPFFGPMAHKTAGDLGTRTVEKYILDIILSDPAVPVKCQIVGAPNGDIWLVAAGRANHDLNMSPAAYAAYRDQTWSLAGYQNLRGTGYNGSGYTLGWEQIAAGIPTEAQRRSLVAFAAELALILGRTGQGFAGHGENASDRDFNDPQQDMGLNRREAMAIVANPGATPPPVTEGFLMALSDNEQKQVLTDTRSILNILSTGRVDGKDWSYPFPLFQARANDIAALVGKVNGITDTLAARLNDPADDLDPQAVADAVVASMGEGLAQELLDALAARLSAKTA